MRRQRRRMRTSERERVREKYENEQNDLTAVALQNRKEEP